MEAWSIGLTVAIALSTVASFTATALFYWWTWKQRNPAPVLASLSILGDAGEAGEFAFAVILSLTNPGEVPIHVLSVSASVRDDGPAITSYAYPGGVGTGAMTIPPHGIAASRSAITLDAKCRETAFPEGLERFWDVELDYVSGGRRRRGTFRKVVAVARSGAGWSSTPLVEYWNRPTYPRE